MQIIFLNLPKQTIHPIFIIMKAIFTSQNLAKSSSKEGRVATFNTVNTSTNELRECDLISNGMVRDRNPRLCNTTILLNRNRQ
jgi:hypothetical protein